MVYPALLPLLPLMRTPRLPVVDWTDAPADLNGLARFAERRNLVSARVTSHFKRSLPQNIWRYIRSVAQIDVVLTGFDCSNILKDFNLCPHKLTSGSRNAGPAVWLLRQSYSFWGGGSLNEAVKMLRLYAASMAWEWKFSNEWQWKGEKEKRVPVSVCPLQNPRRPILDFVTM